MPGLLLSTLLALLPADAGKPSVLVLGLEAVGGVAPEVTALMTEQVVTALQKSGKFGRVTSVADVAAVVGVEKQRQLMDCTDASCMLEIGQALGADLVLAGRAGKVGRTYSVSLRLVSMRESTVVASASRVLQGADEGDLVVMVPSLVDELLGKAPARPRPRPRAARRGRAVDRDDEDELGSVVDNRGGVSPAATWTSLALLGGAAGSALGEFGLIVLAHGLFALGAGLAGAGSWVGDDAVTLGGMCCVACGTGGLLVALVGAGGAVASGVSALVVHATLARGAFGGRHRPLAATWITLSALAVTAAILGVPSGLLIMALGAAVATTNPDAFNNPGTVTAADAASINAVAFVPVSVGFGVVMASGWMLLAGALSLAAAVGTTVLGEAFAE